MKKVKLTQGKYAKIDNDDRAVKKFEWFAHFDGNNWYAKRNVRLENGDRTVISMHEQIKGIPEFGFEIDHIDGNGLNNMRGNLRFVTHRQNMLNKKMYSNNTSGVTGVSWHEASKKWRAYARLDKNLIHLGLFDKKREASIAYKDFISKHYKI